MLQLVENEKIKLKIIHEKGLLQIIEIIIYILLKYSRKGSVGSELSASGISKLYQMQINFNFNQSTKVAYNRKGNFNPLLHNKPEQRLRIREH